LLRQDNFPAFKSYGVTNQEETVSPSLKTGAFLKVLLRIYDTNVINSIMLKKVHQKLLHITQQNKQGKALFLNGTIYCQVITNMISGEEF